MKDEFYGDNNDLVKWGGIVHLCTEKSIKTVLHVAYYRKDEWGKEIDDFAGKSVGLPEAVNKHFPRDIYDIKRLGNRAKLDIQVIDREFKNNMKDREDYNKKVCKKIERLNKLNKKKIVFLDPDKGLRPEKTRTDEHVTANEVRQIWDSLNPGDFLVFYQHRPRGSKNDWKEVSRLDFARRCKLKGIRLTDVRTWSADGISKHVVFYFVEKKKR